MKFEGINHITFAVSDLKKSIEFYKIVFGDRLVAESEKLAYFDLDGVWFALNVEKNIKSQERQRTYTHIAFSMNLENQKKLKEKLANNGISFEDGRCRNSREGVSLYLRDYDGHLIEFHSSNLMDRLKYYSEEREDVKVYV
ncbi:VOC family protein [Fusibacter sp. Q10-2]|uniref:VOC family protein n=1 Tax=Fusibacter ferrireducens TaxID=2785058 RepID=A0ABR9ZWW2_9FIRM|nr:VOC family protein [Fusibacter ferrireducens]